MSSSPPAGDPTHVRDERIFTLALDLMATVGFDGYLKRVNPAWERLLGWTPQELLSRPYADLIHPDDRERTLAEAARLAEPGTESRDFEMRFATRDGAWKWLLVSGRGSPEEQLIYAVGKDITARKQADADLRQSEERFRLLVDGTRDYAIFMLDTEGRVASWNPGAARIKGYHEDEILGKHFSTFYMQEAIDRGHPQHELELAIRDGRYQEEGWRLRKDGTRFWADVVITALRDDAGRPRGFAKVTRDASQRRRNERYMLAQVAVAEVVTEAPPLAEAIARVVAVAGETLDWEAAGFWSPDPDEDVLHCRAFWADDAERLAEFERVSLDLSVRRGEGLPGRVLASGGPEWIRDATVDSNFPRAAPAVSAGLRGAVAVPVLSSGGVVVGVLEFFGSEPLTPDPDLETKLATIAGQVGQFMRRKQTEEALDATTAELRRRAEALERSNAELEQFAYVASHDLSEPLRMVSGFVQLLADRYEGKLGEDADEFIGYTVAGVERMQDLIADLLALSRVGQQVVETDVDLGEVVEAARAALQAAIADAGAIIEAGPLPVVRGDARELTQLFQNLLANGIKFVDEGPPRVRVSARRLDGMWTVSVRDNGIGIEPRHAERIFKMFQRLHARERYPGTGIGLAICKKIVERHGGTIWVEPSESAGTDFRFTLPATKETTP